tara:strand:- start:211 stop:396 length:186 start_codon:yes stop_codon:yes gene_type:complete
MRKGNLRQKLRVVAACENIAKKLIYFNDKDLAVFAVWGSFSRRIHCFSACHTEQLTAYTYC